MKHSRAKTPEEIFEFADKFRKMDSETPLVVVPTTYATVTEEELKAHGINIVIYANQTLRAAFPAVQKVMQTILENGRCYEANEQCMSIKDILSLIPIK